MSRHSNDSAAVGQMTIRLHDGEPDHALRRLADLDGSSVPPAPLLVAELSDEVLAAVSLTDGSLVADPFRPTASAVELLRVRAAQLDESPRPTRRRRLLRGFGQRRETTLAGSPPGAGGRLLQL